jgi:hypothetical protein
MATPLGGQQLAECFLGPPSLVALTIRCRVRINESNKYLRHDPAANRTKTMSARASVGFAENVVPQRSLATPTRGSEANLFFGERDDSDVTHRLAGWQPDALPSLQVTDGERMIVFNLSFTGDGYRQLNQCSHKPSIDFLGSLCRCRGGRVEEQRPVDKVLARYWAESQEIRKEGHGLRLPVQLIAVANLSVAVAIGSVGELQWNEPRGTGTKPLRAFSKHLIRKCLSLPRNSARVQARSLLGQEPPKNRTKKFRNRHPYEWNQPPPYPWTITGSPVTAKVKGKVKVPPSEIGSKPQ